MNKCFVITLFSLLMIFAGSSSANQISVPLQIDYSMIQKIMATQLYTGKGNVAELWNDRQGCSYLKLSDPEINGQNGQVRMLNNVQARFGTGMGGQCLTVLEWAGILETFQQPTLDSGRSVLSFPITKASAYDREGRHLTIDRLQDLIKRFAEPKLGRSKNRLKRIPWKH